MHTSRSHVAIVGCCLAAVTIVCAGAEPPRLFVLGDPTAAAKAKLPGAAEARAIVIEPDILQDYPQRLRFELLDGSVHEAELSSVERRSQTCLTWRGWLVPGRSRVVLTLEDGLVAGVVFAPSGTYEILPTWPDTHLLLRTDPQRSERCGGPVYLDPAALETLPSPPDPSQVAKATDPASRIDVMTLYTPQALAGAGSTAAIQTHIQNAVDMANTAFEDSEMVARFNLVYTGLANHNDAQDLDADLTWLRTDSGVAALRDQYKADLVGMLLETSGGEYAGMGYCMDTVSHSFESLAFQVTLRYAAASGLTLAHEHGHNMGMEHDPANSDPPGSISYDYAHGHFVDGEFRTVMSYASECSQFTPRTAHFSNPSVSHEGLATGIWDNRDNHRVGENTASTVANFRVAAPSGPELQVLNVGVSSQSLSPGQYYTVDALVKNFGDTASAATTLRYFLSTNSTISTADTQMGTDPVAGLAILGQSYESIGVYAPPAGTYWVGACVDSVASETDRGNNCSGGVPISVNMPNPDLAVPGFSASEQVLLPGQQYSIEALIKNLGAGTSSSTTLRYYRSTDANIGPGDTLMTTDSVLGLAPWYQTREDAVVYAPGSEGNYWIGACADAVSGETNTANNCSTALPINVASGPDLVAIEASVDDAPLTTGAALRIEATVKNRGNETSSSTTLRYYRSTNSIIGNTDTQLGTDFVPGLQAGLTAIFDLDSAAPGSEGTYWVGACADSNAGEISTANNCTDGIQITVAAPLEMVFWDGFETGNPSQWSNTVP